MCVEVAEKKEKTSLACSSAISTLLRVETCISSGTGDDYEGGGDQDDCSFPFFEGGGGEEEEEQDEVIDLKKIEDAKNYNNLYTVMMDDWNEGSNIINNNENAKKVNENNSNHTANQCGEYVCANFPSPFSGSQNCKEFFNNNNNNNSNDDDDKGDACVMVSELLEQFEESLSLTQSYASYFSHKQTIIIFDWDDTILPSTWLSENKYSLAASCLIDPDTASVLNTIAECACRNLQLADKFGTVVIVTNAEFGWVQLSCRKFMPSLENQIRHYRILSARSCYESSGCQTPYMWKLKAFKAELERHYGGTCILRPPPEISGNSDDTVLSRNVISLGDSTHERQALLTSCRSMQARYEYKVLAKSIKFMERPTVVDLRRQHEFLFDIFHELMNHNGMLDLCMRSSSIPDLLINEQKKIDSTLTEDYHSNMLINLRVRRDVDLLLP